MRITWLGHSCFKLESSDGTLIFDPYENGRIPGYAFLPKDLSADKVLCSHAHRDHSASELVALSGGKFSGKITTAAGWHDDIGGAKRGENIMTLVETEGLKVIHLGDMGCELSAEQKRLFNAPDVLMLPVGGYYTVEPELAFKTARELGARVVLPMHYRGSGFGYYEIGTLEDYLALCTDENIVRYDTNSIEIDRGTQKQTAVLKYCPH